MIYFIYLLSPLVKYKLYEGRDFVFPYLGYPSTQIICSRSLVNTCWMHACTDHIELVEEPLLKSLSLTHTPSSSTKLIFVDLFPVMSILF